MDYPMTSSMQRREEVVGQAPPAAGLGACIHSDLAQQMALLSRAIDDLQASLGSILRSGMPKSAGQPPAAPVDRSSLHHAVVDLTTQAAALVEQVTDIERRLDL